MPSGIHGPPLVVIPAKAGIQDHKSRCLPWTPAFAGVTIEGSDFGR